MKQMKHLFIALLCALISFLAPIQWVLFLVLYLVSFDTIFAMTVKRRINKKRKKEGLDEDLTLTINSIRFSKSITKILIYMSGLILARISDLVFAELIITILGGVITMPFAYIILIYIMTRELMSIDETLKLSNKGLGFVHYLKIGYNTLIVLKEKINDLIKK